MYKRYFFIYIFLSLFPCFCLSYKTFFKKYSKEISNALLFSAYIGAANVFQYYHIKQHKKNMDTFINSKGSLACLLYTLQNTDEKDLSSFEKKVKRNLLKNLPDLFKRISQNLEEINHETIGRTTIPEISLPPCMQNDWNEANFYPKNYSLPKIEGRHILYIHNYLQEKILLFNNWNAFIPFVKYVYFLLHIFPIIKNDLYLFHPIEYTNENFLEGQVPKYQKYPQFLCYLNQALFFTELIMSIGIIKSTILKRK